MAVALSLPTTVPLDSYDALLQAIAVHMKREQTPEFEGAFAVWVSHVNEKINERLALDPVRPMHAIAEASISSDYITVPQQILDVDSLVIDGKEVFPSDPQDIATLESRYPVNNTGRPQYFAQVGSLFWFYPTPDQTYTARLIYWEKVPPLAESNQTNWVISNHARIYWFGVLAYGYEYYYDYEQRDTFYAAFQSELESVVTAYPSRPNRRGLRSDISQAELSGRWAFLF